MKRKRRNLHFVLLLVSVFVVLTGCVGQPSGTDTAPDAVDDVDAEREAPASSEEPKEREGDASASTDTSGGDGEVVVTYVIDGDTFETGYPDGTEDTVRLVGVDTPEVYSELSPKEFGGANAACLDDWTDRATSYVEKEAEGQNVRIEFEKPKDDVTTTTGCSPTRTQRRHTSTTGW